MRIVKSDYGLKLWASSRDTWDWAHRPGASWPCSELSGRRLFAEFDSGGNLVDIAIDGKNRDCDGHEFTAMTSDFIRAKYPDHPAVKS